VHHHESLYFAYGSNLHQCRMFDRCPGAIPVRSYELIGWKLVFRRTADIVPAVGHTVLGALYRITPVDEMALDRYEGVHRGRYRRKNFLLGSQWAFTYVMNSSYAEEAPSAEYFALIEKGYQDWRLPTAALVAARNASVKVDPLAQRRRE
jgi:gamma-glutamylcyclotransferase (GGCT)/AIG2-like uncharacterized protein YtfP